MEDSTTPYWIKINGKYSHFTIQTSSGGIKHYIDGNLAFSFTNTDK